MLTLTEKAVEAIRDLMVGENLPKEAGLRITPKADDASTLELSLTSVPHDGDQVIRKEDVRVFLDPEAAAALDDQMLDADVSPSGTRMSLYLSRKDDAG
ncbi:hypothetical protein [Planomonospora venezuelensis]|uniref:Fe-S cluster assembly iron-binding protein IscA n=1 Tax=Planomonospora venezuelensis TaxID=1999 RepID=A0A841D7G4_PLAVE|nr:hypothetical protein [Planomonospora venezuelensis]MBB5964437.1 Fe-S cluster assembly iron-binding protein IscA [Planomonospora venezuelensis]GIN04172.1 hypothetical protein Pve01_58300 [Planomonospora venezuelensis]